MNKGWLTMNREQSTFFIMQKWTVLLQWKYIVMCIQAPCSFLLIMLYTDQCISSESKFMFSYKIASWVQVFGLEIKLKVWEWPHILAPVAWWEPPGNKEFHFAEFSKFCIRICTCFIWNLILHILAECGKEQGLHFTTWVWCVEVYFHLDASH